MFPPEVVASPRVIDAVSVDPASGIAPPLEDVSVSVGEVFPAGVEFSEPVSSPDVESLAPGVVSALLVAPLISVDPASDIAPPPAVVVVTVAVGEV
jgi:hypothetical protein